jgi:PAS domain S-box-containing protein
MDKKAIHILLIEDNPGDARLIGEMLAEAPSTRFSLKHSDSLSDGLIVLTENTHDVILLDLGLPDSLGLDSINEITKVAPMIPIVMLTGFDDEKTAVAALQFGVQDYLVKGRIDSDLLAHSIRYAIERKQIEEELRRHREELMMLVEERTAELQKSNVALLMEIAERKRVNELLENIFSNVHVLIAYMDTDFNFIRVNNKYAEADEQEPEFFIGRNHFDLYPDKENEAIFKKVAETGTPFFVRAKPFRYPKHPERGTSFWDWSLVSIKNAGGNVTGLVLSLINVTENITLYSELMRSEHLASVGKLAAGVAHEVNNPINGIINYAQILLNKFDEESQEHEIATRIIKESDRIACIVRSLLSFARVNKEGKKPVHVTEILSDALLLTETQLKKSGIRLEVHIDKNLPLIIAQPQHIEQVFLNLISNACHALNLRCPSEHRDKLIRISAEAAAIHHNPHVRITFYDQGIGIPSEIKNKIFDPFFTTKSGSEGTGLGLSISHGIIMDHDGGIKIESVENKFTRIVIDLPAQA